VKGQFRVCPQAELQPRKLVRALNIEDVQDWTLRRRPAGAFGDSACQQALESFQVTELGPYVFEMMRGNLAHLATRRLFWSPEPDQRADFIERESQFAGPPYEDQSAKMS
jgi:hypothetical protein